jgi:hypothetical protein
MIRKRNSTATWRTALRRPPPPEPASVGRSNTAFPLLAFIAKSAVLPNGIILGLASPLSP